MKKTLMMTTVPMMTGILFSGCVMHEVKPEKGVESSVISGYLQENGIETNAQNTPCETGNCVQAALHDPESGKSNYERERDRKLASIVKTSPTPMRVPDTVLRVLINPYVDDSGTLTVPGYKFTRVDDGKWILGEYLVKEGSAVKMLTPLTVNTINSSEQTTPKQSAQAQQSAVQQGMINPMMQNPAMKGED